MTDEREIDYYHHYHFEFTSIYIIYAIVISFYAGFTEMVFSCKIMTLKLRLTVLYGVENYYYQITV